MHDWNMSLTIITEFILSDKEKFVIYIKLRVEPPSGQIGHKILFQLVAQPSGKTTKKILLQLVVTTSGKTHEYTGWQTIKAIQ